MISALALMIALTIAQAKQYPHEITIPLGPPGPAASEKSDKQWKHLPSEPSQVGDSTADRPGAKMAQIRVRHAVYFVPYGRFPPGKLEELASFCRAKYGVEVEILQPLPLPEGAYDSSTEQFIAEKLVADMRSAYPQIAHSPQAILMGFILSDMKAASIPQWNFVFGWRTPRLRSAVISVARFFLPNPAMPAEEVSPDARMRKVAARYIGILYFGLPLNSRRHSVL